MNPNSITRLAAPALLCVGLLLAQAAEAREQIRIVGSSTVYPFSTAVAEEFGRNSKWKAPIV
jgi:phosphate transport system substrate-binding protein